MKAKIKGKSINKGTKYVEDFSEFPTPLGSQLNYNPFMPNLDKNLPRITLNDPLITAIQIIIDNELELTKLNEEELELIIGIVNGRRIPD